MTKIDEVSEGQVSDIYLFIFAVSNLNIWNYD